MTEISINDFRKLYGKKKIKTPVTTFEPPVVATDKNGWIEIWKNYKDIPVPAWVSDSYFWDRTDGPLRLLNKVTGEVINVLPGEIIGLYANDEIKIVK